MTEIIRFRCRNCGHRFETKVLDENEQRDARRTNQPTSPVCCPECMHTDLLRGWY